MRTSYLFTSESVSEGHPDKVADQISDAIVDLFLSKDPEARVACETLVTTQRIVIGGEVRCKGAYDEKQFGDTHGWAPGVRDEIEQTVRHVVKRIGYEQEGFHWQTASFENHLHGQSAHIAQGVDASGNKDEGAGDQGIMFGYATDETPDLLPATLYYSHNILKRMADDRHSGRAPFLEPDAKSQVTLRYENGKPAAATAIVVSTQHAKGYDEGEKEAELHAYVKQVVADVLPAELLSDDTVYHINPTGSFEIGGPDGDAGLTGRKIIVDTYGGAAPHGGGAFSGKDPTKVDRSAAYAARYLAKNIIAAGLAKRCTIQLSYAIGVPEPLSLYVDTHGTGTVGDDAIETAIGRIGKLGRLTPRGIRTHLGLNKPIYSATAAYGHFGRTPEGDLFPWEKTDLVEDLKAALGEVAVRGLIARGGPADLILGGERSMDRFTGGCLCGAVRIAASGLPVPGRPLSLSRLPQASWGAFLPLPRQSPQDAGRSKARHATIAGRSPFRLSSAAARRVLPGRSADEVEVNLGIAAMPLDQLMRQPTNSGPSAANPGCPRFRTRRPLRPRS